MNVVHQTLLEYPPAYIFVTNVDIPTATFGEPDLLERLRNFLSGEYNPDLAVYFEVSATYTLVHRDSGETRRWVGSFSPQQTYTLTPNLTFPSAFYPVVRPLLNLRTLTRQLEQLIPNTVWIVDEVRSLILHVSARVPRTYPRLIAKGLLNEYGGRSQKKIHVTVVP